MLCTGYLFAFGMHYTSACSVTYFLKFITTGAWYTFFKAELVDKLSPAAEIIGACNVFVNDDGVITGHITDGVGFVKNLELNGVPVKDKKVVVLGAGGAATAIQVQLALDGAKEINIFSIQDKFFERAKGTQAKLAESVRNVLLLLMIWMIRQNWKQQLRLVIFW